MTVMDGVSSDPDQMSSAERVMRGQALEPIVVRSAVRELWRGLEARLSESVGDAEEHMAYVAGLVLGRFTSFDERWR